MSKYNKGNRSEAKLTKQQRKEKNEKRPDKFIYKSF